MTVSADCGNNYGWKRCGDGGPLSNVAVVVCNDQHVWATRQAADNSAALRSLKVARAATVRSHIKSRRRDSLHTDRRKVVAIEKPEYWNQNRKQLTM